jgi:ABC-type microcin C transport system permease subunit YejB
MTGYIIRRLLIAIPTLLILVVICFLLMPRTASANPLHRPKRLRAGRHCGR